MSDNEKKLLQEIERLRDEKNRVLDLMEEMRREQREMRPPADFVQLDRATMRAIRNLTAKSPSATRILMFMAEKMNKQNAIMVSNEALLSITGITKPTLVKAMKILRDEKWIKQFKVGTSNAYFINSAVFWTSKLKNKQFAEFTASVITTESEQNESFQEWEDVKLQYMPLVDHSPEQERVTLSNEILPPPDQLDIELD